jgi:hypothetical protein
MMASEVEVDLEVCPPTILALRCTASSARKSG